MKLRIKATIGGALLASAMGAQAAFPVALLLMLGKLGGGALAMGADEIQTKGSAPTGAAARLASVPGGKMAMIQARPLLTLDEALFKVFPTMESNQISELREGLLGPIESLPTQAQQDEALAKTLSTLEAMAQQRRGLAKLSSVNRDRVARESGLSCQSYGPEFTKAAMEVMVSQWAPWPKDAAKTWVQACAEATELAALGAGAPEAAPQGTAVKALSKTSAGRITQRKASEMSVEELSGR